MSSQPPMPGASPEPSDERSVADDAAGVSLEPGGHEPEEGGDAPAWRRRGSTVWRYARWPLAGAAALVVLTVAAGIWLWVTTDMPVASVAGDSAILVDRNGEELAVLAQDGLRIEVPLEEMASSVRDAVVAAEDRRFFDHDGLDPMGITRAVWNNVTDSDTEGGSTITQQLVKNVYLDDERTITRKLREAVLAVKLEQSSTKEEILERYLNSVYFGRGAYGIEAAARTYFETSAADLAPEQAALLVGILRAPESLDPGDAPDAALERRNAVLRAMAEMGALDPAAASDAEAVPIEVRPESSPTTLSAGVAPHFVEQVRADIVERFGERALYDRGLVVHTTLDIEDQAAAEAAVAANLDDPDDPQAAVVGIDRSGAIRVWVGGRDFEELKVDLVSDEAGSGRQPGSTFKPFVLAANLAAGNGAGQTFRAPAQITIDTEPEPWEVENAGGRGYGRLTLAEATINSVNTVFAQAVMQVGPEAVADLAADMGIERELDAQPSIALGVEEVTPLDLATAYSTFARSGTRTEPFRVTKVETRDGNVLWEMDGPEQVRVLEPEVADAVSSILSETPRRGTARRAALDRPMAAKTGTTQRNADAWLAGYTPEYTAVVWMGYAGGNRAMETVDDIAVQGGSVPAMIWHDFMVEALRDVEPTPFAEPDPELLRDTGRADRVRPSSSGERVTRSSTTTSTSSTSTTSSSTTSPEDEDEDEATSTTTSSTTTAPSTTTSPTTTAPSTTTTQPSTSTTAQEAATTTAASASESSTTETTTAG